MSISIRRTPRSRTSVSTILRNLGRLASCRPEQIGRLSIGGAGYLRFSDESIRREIPKVRGKSARRREKAAKREARG